ncbi:hypothetical protein [Nitratiruptor sp. SB155-2]|uniref:hypothetical protein n=1 Tax=Nitratiruptor sp. (strain SB155-2) TaxID=387092 RepID=UPI0001586F2E|nr:hypothetical protein [Nitratiruptor sp. SB155-2]BAF69565.1 phage-related protein [Nitratiruptor sp. SB155-2]BAN05323.1 hypothetical protein [Nitratiruptor phage NrS-1]
MVEQILEERGNIYGDFNRQAKISQQLKQIVLEANPNITKHPPVAEGIEMILHKIARIANGKELYIENFRDIAGYAQLIADAIEHIEGAIDANVTYKTRGGEGWLSE